MSQHQDWCINQTGVTIATYLLAIVHLVTVSAFRLVAKRIPMSELTKLKFITAKVKSKVESRDA